MKSPIETRFMTAWMRSAMGFQPAAERHTDRHRHDHQQEDAERGLGNRDVAHIAADEVTVGKDYDEGDGRDADQESLGAADLLHLQFSPVFY